SVPKTASSRAVPATAAVPSFSALRIQRNSLGSFDFGNGQDGLFGLKGTAAVAGTALDDAVFGTLLLPAAGKPRSVDLWPAFHTGVPNVRPYQLATGKNGDPLAAGKPFVNNFFPNGGDMLRLNMATPVTDRTSPDFSTLGLIQAAVLGLTDSRFNADASLQNIPNMDGFPNGRRLEDDVTRIELQAVSGAVLAAIGLWYDDFNGTGSPVTTDLLDVLTYSTGIEANDTSFRASFPYVQTPWAGDGKCGGLAVQYDQPMILNATAIEKDVLFQPLKVYPIPANSQLNIDFSSDRPQGIEITIYDITGKTMGSYRKSVIAGANTIDVPVESLIRGSYLIKMTGENGLLGTAKFIKR
ncbi:MAG: DUF4331 family protein, partial [Bacteroidota bacterium]